MKNILQFITAISFLLTACAGPENQAPENDVQSQAVEKQVHQTDTITYLALGDSYTIGQSVVKEGAWPVQLAAKLSQTRGIYVSSPTILATTGWTTTDLSQAIDAAGLDNEHYDLVSLLIGVNNEYQKLSIDDYAAEFSDLLERAIQIAGDSSRVFVVSIPDYGYSPFGYANQSTISPSIEAYNRVCKEITLSHGVKHYNITPISQEAIETAGFIAMDGLHPSAVQYGSWVDSFYQDVMNQIK